MKTETLIELQRSITQGEWRTLPSGDICTTLKTEIDFGGTTGKRPVQLIIGKVNNYTTRAPEPIANARAIALVPELIAEVIRLREVLRACATQLDAETLGGEALDSARAALENDK